MEPKEKTPVRGSSSGFAIRSHEIKGFAIPPFLYCIANANTQSWRITNPPEREEVRCNKLLLLGGDGRGLFPFEGRGMASEARPELAPVLACKVVPAADGGMEEVGGVGVEEVGAVAFVDAPPGLFDEGLFALSFVEEVLLRGL